MKVTVSDQLKKAARKAIWSISLLIFTYATIITLVIGLTILCGLAGIILITTLPYAITICIGLALFGMSLLVLIFLITFIIKRHEPEKAQLIEIYREQEPELYHVIQQIVDEVHTDFPKKIYLSSEVNASVFYHSSFWSMFFPVRKNLQIGLGLINSVSVDEFKAILGHEFGHFSQKSMRIGSYVYFTNHMIYHLLYDNDPFKAFVEKWGKVHRYAATVLGVGVNIIKRIQSLLKKIYQSVNLNYLKLSREMEFHADEIAALVAGPGPVISSLLRANLAQQSYDTVLNFYSGKISAAIATENIYPQQFFIMQFLAKEHKFPIEHNLPVVSLEQLNRLNQSKLVYEDPWASHPGIPERISRLRKMDIPSPPLNNAPASSLFTNIAAHEAKITEILFSAVSYPESPKIISDQQFASDYLEEYKSQSFHEWFNSYYDHKNPEWFDLEEAASMLTAQPLSVNTLFTDQWVDLVYTFLSLENDLQTITQIAREQSDTTFEYDNVNYTSQQASQLVTELNVELTQLKNKIQEHDRHIFQEFYHLASLQDREQELISGYQALYELEKKHAPYQKIVAASQFMHEDMSIDQIPSQLNCLKEIEADFKKHVHDLLAQPIYQQELTTPMIKHFHQYLSKDWRYFYQGTYQEELLNILFSAIQYYYQVVYQTSFSVKRTLLELKVSLVEKEGHSV